MKKWPGKWKIWTALLLMLMVLPVSARAALGNNAVDAHVVTLKAEVGDAYATLRFPMVAVLDPDAGNYPLYFQVEGLPAGESYWLEATLGDAVAEGRLSAAGTYAGLWLRFEGESGQAESLTVSVYADETKQELCYQSITQRILLAAALDYDLTDAVASVQPVEIDRAAQSATVSLLLPAGTVAQGTRLQAQLLSESGGPYGYAEADVTVFGDILTEDSRYKVAFPEENPYRVTAQSIKVDFTFSRIPEPGHYDLKLSDLQQDLSWTYADVLICSDLPVAEILSWTDSVRENRPDGRTAAIQLHLIDGAPDDFAVALWWEDVQLGTSDGWRVESVTGQEAVVTYRIPLSEPLEENQQYRAAILCDKDFCGEAQANLPRFSAEETMADRRNSRLDSDYFACFTVLTAGFAEKRLYRVELQDKNGLLAAQLASPDETGLFTLAFTEDGAPLPVDPQDHYRLIFSEWTEDGWQQCAAVDLTRPETPDFEGAAIRPLALWTEDLPLYYGAENCGEQLLPLRMQLYRSDGTFAPVSEVAWAAAENPVLTEEPLPKALAYKPMDAVILADGIPAALLPSGYWFAQSRAESLVYGAQDCVVQLTCGENGRAVLYCNGQPVTGESLPPLSEIYVHAIPEPGFEVCAVAVNQTPVAGRAFLLTKDTQIDVTFRKRTDETFAVALEYDSTNHYLAGGTVSVSTDHAALEETVELTAEIQPGYTVHRLEVLLRESGRPVPLIKTDNGWRFSMPGGPVRVVAAIRPLYQPHISVEINNSYGTLAAPEQATEGQWVTLQAIPHAASTLERLELVYLQASREVRENLLPTLTDGNTYRFRVPAAEQVTLEAVFAQPPFYSVSNFVSEQGTVTASAPSSVPAEKILLTVTPAPGFRLKKNSIQVQTMAEGQLHAVSLEDGPSFLMPWGDVRITAVFEPIPPAAPGSLQISTQQQLAAALGGAENTFADPDGMTVHLLKTVEVQAPLVFTGGNLVLHLGDAILYASPELAQAPVQVQSGASVTLSGASGSVDACGAGQTALLLSGGSLTVCGGSYRGVCALQMTAESKLLLNGGSFYGQSLALRLLNPVGDYLDRHVTASHAETGAVFGDGWTAQHEIAQAVCFACRTPAFAASSVAAQRTGENLLTLSVPVTFATEDALLLAAVYDADGRMTGMAQSVCTRGAEEISLALPYNGTPCCGTVFLLDSAHYDPQSAAVPIAIP